MNSQERKRSVWEGREAGLVEELCVSAGTVSQQEAVALQDTSRRPRADDWPFSGITNGLHRKPLKCPK